MDYFCWDKKYETGIDNIDRQHQKLVDLLNQYSHTLSVNSELPAIEQSLKLLTDYVIYHFRDEEKALHDSALSEKEKGLHLREHMMFTYKVATLTEDNDLNDREFAEDLHQFLYQWMSSHFLTADMKLAQAIKNSQPEILDDTYASAVGL